MLNQIRRKLWIVKTFSESSHRGAILAFVLGCAAQRGQHPQAVDLNPKITSGQMVQKVDAFEVIFDATLSMNDMYKGGSKLNQEKALVNLFNDTIPNLKLTAAARAFGRVHNLRG